jgi:Holliday junction resolvasome RuvABC ATP-dependent DNA helicase subunit
MAIQKQLADYTYPELGAIGRKVASNLHVVLKAQAINRIARISLGSPRRIKQILQGMGRHYGTDKKEWTIGHVREYLAADGCDPEGYERQQVRYLEKLHGIGHASLDTMAAMMGVDTDYLFNDVEVPLLRAGMFTIGGHGRELTEKGRGWVADRKARQKLKQKSNTEGGGNNKKESA